MGDVQWAWRCWRGAAVWATLLPVGKRRAEEEWRDFFGWLARRGSYCQKWFLLGLKLGLKKCLY